MNNTKNKTCWAILPALLPLVALQTALAFLLQANLESLNFSGWQDNQGLLWSIACSLCLADAVLLHRFQTTFNPIYIIGVVIVFALCLALEWLNVSNSVHQSKAPATIAEAGVQPIETQIQRVSATIKRLQETRSVWDRDGIPGNDNDLINAEASLAKLEADLAIAKKAAASESAGLHFIASIPNLSTWLLAGCAALKLVILLLAWSVSASLIEMDNKARAPDSTGKQTKPPHAEISKAKRTAVERKKATPMKTLAVNLLQTA